MYREILAISTGAVVFLMLAICLHIALYPALTKIAERHHVPWPYIVGCIALGVGLVVVGAMSEQWFVAVAYWSVLIPGGIAIAAAWWVRGWLERRKDSQQRAQRIIQRAEEALSRAVSRESDDRRN